jgi:hypothetical protein
VDPDVQDARAFSLPHVFSLGDNREELRDGAPLIKKFIAGATSGAIGAGLANPADLVKVKGVQAVWAG